MKNSKTFWQALKKTLNKLIRLKPTNSIAKFLVYLACLAMVSNPIVHAQAMSISDEGWAWLCTSQGLKYVNLNADSDEESQGHIKQHNEGSCCLYDDESASVTVVVNHSDFIRQNFILSIYEFSPNNSFLYHFTRAPPFNISLV